MKEIITLLVLFEFVRDLRHGDLHGWRSWTRLSIQIVTILLLGSFLAIGDNPRGWTGLLLAAGQYLTFRVGFFNPATGYIRRQDWDHLGDTPIDNIMKKLPSKWIRAAIYATSLLAYILIS